MGATAFCLTISATSASEAFNALYSEALQEHGHDPYNGTISTCRMGRCMKSFPTYNKQTYKEAYNYVMSNNNGVKWTAHYIDMGVEKYIKTTVKKKVVEYTAKFRQKYCVIDCATGRLVDQTSTFDTKTEADKKAMTCALKGMWVEVKKDMVKISGNNTVSTFETVQETTTHKPKATKANANINVQEVHRYMFYGWAAC